MRRDGKGAKKNLQKIVSDGFDQASAGTGEQITSAIELLLYNSDCTPKETAKIMQLDPSVITQGVHFS